MKILNLIFTVMLAGCVENAGPEKPCEIEKMSWSDGSFGALFLEVDKPRRVTKTKVVYEGVMSFAGERPYSFACDQIWLQGSSYPTSYTLLCDVDTFNIFMDATPDVLGEYIRQIRLSRKPFGRGDEWWITGCPV
tara:strand:+ start:2335 stop:2739 length:405 start_codon:yes stop_codon:yes gene_type:complete